jgi:hypothetical protein
LAPFVIIWGHQCLMLFWALLLSVAGCLYHGFWLLESPSNLRATVLALFCLQFLVYLFVGDAAARLAACSFDLRACRFVFASVVVTGLLVVGPAFLRFRPLPPDSYSTLFLLAGLFGALAIRTLVAYAQLKQDAVTRRSR